MAQRGPNSVGLALVLLVVFQVVYALDKCKTGCDGQSGPFKFTPGTTYKYDYDGKINILLSTAEGEQSSTEVKATVLLTQQADCSQVLRLQNVQIVGPDGKKHTGLPSIDKPVVLNNNNGALSDFMCTEPGENQNSLNLKRAIASLFQANLEKTTEVDVFGQCPTYVSKTVDGDITTITKNKNLNKCAFRETITNDLLTSTFNIRSDIQSSPVLNSNLDSKQKIKAGILDSANVVENYLFVPFSVGQNGAKAIVESKLTLTGTSKDTPSTKTSVPKSIIFENPHPVNLVKTNMNAILKKVRAISDNLGAVVEDKVALEFIGLIKLLRVSKKPDILSVYNQIRSGSGFTDKEAVKKIFLDAVLTAGTGDTIEVAIELLKNKELSPFEEKQLFGGLSKARHVTENSIKTATDLLNRANLPKEAYLGIGALAGRYCTQHKCENVEAVNKIIQKFLSKLGDFKAANRKEENDMIFVMKGLTNIGFLNDAIPSKIVSLAEDKKQPIRLRVSTLEAYQAAPCKDKLRDSALKILKDTQQDSEIRIKAYLALTACPNEKVGKAVKALLENEKSQQVGGFISSHIRNLRSSTNPDKLLAKTHLGFVPPNRFLFDPRKYSFNAEFSYSVDALGMADNVEGTVIYSQTSYLPRSANMNLTSEIFGHRFNYLELAVRQENLDRVIEHYLGPEGILRKATLQQNYDNLAKPIANLLKNLKEKVDKSLRSRRDVSKADIEAINKKIQIKSNELDRNLDLDLSIKTFGNEIMFMNSFDITEKLSPQGIIDGLVKKLNDGLNNLKSFEKTLRLNLLFLDAELSYPTSLGFPLRLGVDGASNIQVKTSGNIDVRDIISESPDNDMNLKISIIPSASVTIIGRFTLDTPLIENGLKVASTLHTSSGGQIEVQTFNAARGLDVKFHMPVQKQELIGLKHHIIYQTKENGVATNKDIRFTQNKDFSICVDHLAQFIGMQFCADINGPNLSGKKVPILPFPLSGNARVSIRVERGDIDTIHYRREFISNKDGKLGVEANLESLRNNKEKAAGVKVEAYVTPDMYVKVLLNSPIKNAEGEARLVLNDKEKVLALSVKDENKVLYSAKAGLQVDGGADKTIYHPILQYTTPQNQSPQTPPLHVEGKVVAVKNGNDIKYTLDDVTLIIPNRKNIVFSGNLGTEGPAYYSDVKASDGTLSGSLSGRLEAHPDLVKIQAEMKNSIKPSLNFNVKGEFKKQRNPDLISSNIQFTHGEDLKSTTNVLTLINSLSVKNPKDPKTMEVTTKNKITYPLFKIGGKFELEKTPKSLHYDTFGQNGDLKLGSEMKLKVNTKSVGDYQLELNVFDIKNLLEVKSSRQVVGPDDSKISNSIGLNNRKVEVNGKIKHRVKPGDLNVGADLTVKVPSNKNPIKLNGQLKLNPRELDTHLKILSGKTSVIDTSLKGNRNGDANGHIKVNLKDALTVDGQITSKKGVGKGNAVIDFKPLKKTTKIDTTFTIQRPKFNLLVNLYPAFNEDPNKKITLNTNNEINGNTIHSKSNLDILGNQYALNANAQLSSLLNGKTTADADLTLPGPLYLSGKLTRDATTKEGTVNSDTTIVLGQSKDKATPGRKLTVKVVAKNTNFKDGVVDVNVNVAADDSAGKNANLDVSLKRQKNGDKRILNFNNKITSSLLSSPIESTYNAEYSKAGAKFNMKASVDPKASIKVDGEINGDTSVGPKKASASVDLALPTQTMSNIKTSVSLMAKPPQGNQQGTVDLSGTLQTTSNLPNLNIDATGSLNLEGNKKGGKVTINQVLTKPVTLTINGSGGLNIDREKKTGTANGNFKIVLPNNGIVQGSGTITRVSPREYNLEATLDLPTKAHKSNKLKVHTKRSDNDISSQATLESDGKKHTLNTELSLNPREPKIDIQMTCPEGKLSQISANLKKPSNDRVMGNIKILSQRRDFILEAGLDVNTENPNNIYLQVTGNCPKLNIKDIVFKIGGNSNPDKNNVNVLLTSAGKNILSGDAKITNRQEQGKNIIEGSGDFKVGNENKSGNFKYIRTVLTSDKNGENGNEISFDATIGTKAIDAELKITDKEFRYLYSFCEASKQCAHIEIDAKTTRNELARYDGQLEVTIDLRVLGLPTEFGLKSVTHRDNLLLDHTVDVHFENAANKYKYTLSIHPSQFEISLTTPNRIIALEGVAKLPSVNLQNGGKASGEIAFYTDKKNNPNTKSSLTASVDLDVQKRTVDAEAKLNIVNMNRPLVIKYSKTAPKPDMAVSGTQKLIVDIFASPDQKIVASQTYSAQYDKNTHKAQAQSAITVKSTGLGLDVAMNHAAFLDPKGLSASIKASSIVGLSQNKYENIIKMSASTKEANLLIKALNNVIVEIQSTIAIQKGQIDMNSEVKALGFEPIEADFQIKDYNSITFTRFLKSDPNNKLVVKAAVIPGQTAELGVEQQTGGTSNPLVLISIGLGDKNFLKPMLNIQGNKLKELSSKIRTIAENQAKETAAKFRESVEKLGNDGNALLEKAKTSIPDGGKAVQFYQKEATAFKQELAADKTLQAVAQLLENGFNMVVGLIGKVITAASNIIGRTAHAIVNAVTDVVNHFKAVLLPKLKVIAMETIQYLQGIIDILERIIFTLLMKACELMKSFEPQLEVIASTVSDVLQDVFKAIHSVVENIKNAVLQQYKQVQQQLKNSAMFAELKAQYHDIIKNGLPSQDVLVNTMRASFGALRELIPLPEVQQFIDQVGQYLEKVITQKPVDDVAEIRKIGGTAINLVTKMSGALAKEILPDLLRNSKIPTFNVDLLRRLPSLGSVRVSALNYLLQEDLTPIARFLLRLAATPRDFMIFSDMSAIVALSNVFTLDGRIYYLPAENCNYLLAADAVNGNFSIVGTFKNKIFSGITLDDKSGTITLTSDKKLLLDNVEVEVPVQKGSLRVYRTKAFYYIESKTGVRILCEVNFLGCDINISGFYRGQIRGLLGNGNNEQFDDGMLPNGKIVDKPSEIASAYAVGSQCTPSQMKEIEEPKSDPTCEKMFNFESPLRLCYPFVDRRPPKRACDYGAAQGDKDIHRMVASLYTYLCYKSNIPVEIPGDISEQCSNSMVPRKLDEQFSVKLPGKSADVLLLVSTDKANEVLYSEYGQTLVTAITKEFKAKGIDDVVFHAIAYGGGNQKPSFVSVGGQISFKDKAPKLTFSESPKPQKLVTGITDVDRIIGFIRTLIHDLKTVLGLTLESDTYADAIDYPFRVEAVRTTVAITSESCEHGLLIPLQVAKAVLMNKRDINVNLITPTKDFKVKDVQTTKDVIGFNSENVITLSEASSKPTGSPALQKFLSYNDLCSDYTVGVGGNVFVSDNLLANKDKKEQISQAIAKTIVTGATSKKVELECTCGYTMKHPVNPYNHCKPIEVKEA